jgi:CheY-like chemotaxis protein
MILPRTTILEVLLAHPHPASTRALQQALRGRGHAPVTVSSIDETEERLHGARWDGVVVSAAFGLEAAAFLHRTRRAGRTLPIAALVEACSTAKQVALLDEGFDQVFECLRRSPCGSRRWYADRGIDPLCVGSTAADSWSTRAGASSRRPKASSVLPPTS